MNNPINVFLNEEVLDEEVLEPIAPEVIDINEKLEAISIAAETLEDLSKIRDVITKTSNPDKESMQLAIIAIENIKNNLGIFNTEPSISMESINGSSIALENSISSFFKSIWDAIVRTFKALWNTIRSIFGFTTETEQEKKKVDEIVVKIKKEIKEGPKEVVDETPQVIHKQQGKDNNSILNRFAYLGDTINVDNLGVDLTNLKLSIASCKLLINNFKDTIEILETFGNLDFWLHTSPDDVSAVLRGILTNYYGDVSKRFFGTDHIQEYRKDLSEQLNIDLRQVNLKSVSSLPGMTRNVKIFAFVVNQSEPVDLFPNHFTFLVTRQDTDNHEPKVNLPIENRLYYSEEISSLLEDVLGLQKYHSESTAYIFKTQDKLVKELNTIVTHAIGDKYQMQDMQRKIQFIINLTKIIITNSVAIRQITKAIANSKSDHSKLVSYLDQAKV